MFLYRASRLAMVVPLFFLACAEEAPPPPSRGEVEALLRLEAESEKQKGEEDVNPALGVTVTYTILGVDVREQPGNEAEPWAGTIHFRIDSETPELDSTSTDSFERSYDYVFTAADSRWSIR